MVHPGRVVQVGETLKEAVVREVRERPTGSGSRGAGESHGADLSRPDGGVAYHYVLVDFLCRRLGGTCRRIPTPRRPLGSPQDLSSYQLSPRPRSDPPGRLVAEKPGSRVRASGNREIV